MSVRPNPSIERTSKGWPRYAGSSFFASRGQPLAAAGTMLNTLAAVAVVLNKLPRVDRSQDPGDNFVLAMVEAGEADYLVTGDRRDLLALKRHDRTHIVRVREFLKALGLDRP